RGVTEEQVDPDDFMAATYARAMAHRQPLYAAMARNWGVTVKADDVARVRSAADFTELVAAALEMRG
ncbi:MAG: ATPase, partial [Maritimibacter sp.]|nr:ATPase [Maritimibacter sp.]